MRSSDEPKKPFSYVVDYINNYNFVDKSKTPPFAKNIFYKLMGQAQTRMLFAPGSHQQLQNEIVRLFQIEQEELEKKLQDNLKLLEDGLEYIQNSDVSYAILRHPKTEGYIKNFNESLNNNLSPLLSSDFRGDIFLGEYTITDLAAHNMRHMTIENSYNWSNYILLASKFIIDPNKRSAIAERANHLKDKIRKTETQLSAQMLHNEKKFSISGGCLLAAGIALIALACLLPIPIVPTIVMLVIGGYALIGGAMIGGIGIAGFLIDKNQKKERANYFTEIDTRNSELIKEAKSGLKSTKQERLSHSGMIKVMGAPNRDRQSESQLDTKSKSSASVVKDTPKNPNEIELTHQSGVPDKPFKR